MCWIFSTPPDFWAIAGNENARAVATTANETRPLWAIVSSRDSYIDWKHLRGDARTLTRLDLHTDCDEELRACTAPAPRPAKRRAPRSRRASASARRPRGRRRPARG